MLPASNYPPGSPVYTWIEDDGTNIHIDAVLLRDWVLTQDLETYFVPIDPHLAKTFITENICNPLNMFALTPLQRRERIIFGKRLTFTDGRPDVIFIDGHHRYLRAAYEHDLLIPSVLLEVHQWKPFQIEGLRNLTQDQLRAAPIKGIHQCPTP